jgi:uncharacterized membrane protein YdbT with pleckstrin-like domain
MLYQQNSGKLFQVILTLVVLGMTSACESESNRLTMLKVAETEILKSEQRAVAAEARMKELSRKLQEAEKAKTAAIETRQVAEQQLEKAKGEVTFHTVMNVIFVGLIIAAFFAGLRQGERRRNDNDVTHTSMSDDPYIETYAHAANAGSLKPRSSRS